MANFGKKILFMVVGKILVGVTRRKVFGEMVFIGRSDFLKILVNRLKILGSL
jgi:hypothetical protein